MREHPHGGVPAPRCSLPDRWMNPGWARSPPIQRGTAWREPVRHRHTSVDRRRFAQVLRLLETIWPRLGMNCIADSQEANFEIPVDVERSACVT